MSFNPHLALVTNNPHKMEEWLSICQVHAPWLTVTMWSPTIDIEENGLTFEANADLKAQAALAGDLPSEVQWVVGEDAGLIVPALSGTYGLTDFPGVYSNRWFTLDVANQLGLTGSSSETRNKALLTLMENQLMREAYYTSSLVCYECKRKQRFLSEGRLSLTVSTEAKGDGGFGYDPIMLSVDGRSIAQLLPEEKNAISHRRLAINGLLEQLVKTLTEPIGPPYSQAHPI